MPYYACPNGLQDVGLEVEMMAADVWALQTLAADCKIEVAELLRLCVVDLVSVGRICENLPPEDFAVLKSEHLPRGKAAVAVLEGYKTYGGGVRCPYLPYRSERANRAVSDALRGYIFKQGMEKGYHDEKGNPLLTECCTPWNEEKPCLTPLDVDAGDTMPGEPEK